MNQSDVPPFIFSRLAALGMGHLERRPLLAKPAAAKLSAHLHDYAKEKRIYMKINFVNPEHVHALIDLPTSLSVEAIMQLFKGGSSHWVTSRIWWRASLVGGAVMAYSPFRSRQWTKYRLTSPVRKSIIGRRILWKN